jgi:hypothetical protein
MPMYQQPYVDPAQQQYTGVPQQPQVMMMDQPVQPQYDMKGTPQPMFQQQVPQYDNKVPQQSAVPIQGMPGTAYLTVAVTPIANLGSQPALVDCPSCGTRVLTRAEHQIGNTNQ